MNPVVLRIVTTLVVAAGSGGLTLLVHPLWDPGYRSLVAAVGCAFVNALIAQVMIVQPLLGYWVEEDSDRKTPMTRRERWTMLTIGIALAVVSAMLFPLIDRHSGGETT